MKLVHGSTYQVLHRVDTLDGYEFFKKLHGVSWHEYIVEKEVFTVQNIWPALYRFVVFAEPDDNSFVYHVLVIEDDEHLHVLSDGRREDAGHFFTGEPMAFIRLVRDGKVQSTLVTNDSPFDMDPTETEPGTFENLLKAVNEKLRENGEDRVATIKNTLFVSQL